MASRVDDDDDESIENLLPTDQDLVGRSKVWAVFLNKNENMDEDVENGIIFGAACKSMKSVTGESSGSISEGSFESIPVLEFEDNKEKDTDFSPEDLALCKKMVEKQRERLNQTGLDSIMDSFCLDDINKVENWLRNHDSISSNTTGTNKKGPLTKFSNQIINHIQVDIQHSSDQESSGSVDTAEYILSNRKKIRTRVTLTTIKKYRFREKQKLLIRNKAPGFARELFKDNLHSEDELNKQGLCVIRKKPESEKKFLDRLPYKALVPRDNLRHKQRRPYRRHLRDSSLSSSSSAENKNRTRYKDNRKSYRRHTSLNTRKRKFYRSRSSSSSSSSSSTYFAPQKLSFSRSKEIASPFHNKNIKKITERLKPNYLPSCDRRQSLHSRNNQHIINSTALKTHESMVSHKKNFAAFCDSANETNAKDSFKSNNSQNSNKTQQIVLYTPKKPLSDYPGHVISDGKVRITEKYLEDIIGEEMKKIFIGDRRDFVREFDIKSEIIFIPPDNTLPPSGSDDDCLDTLSKNKTGRILEIAPIV